MRQIVVCDAWEGGREEGDERVLRPNLAASIPGLARVTRNGKGDCNGQSILAQAPMVLDLWRFARATSRSGNSVTGLGGISDLA